jgi:hypothetical protein
VERAPFWDYSETFGCACRWAAVVLNWVHAWPRAIARRRGRGRRPRVAAVGEEAHAVALSFSDRLLDSVPHPAWSSPPEQSGPALTVQVIYEACGQPCTATCVEWSPLLLLMKLRCCCRGLRAAARSRTNEEYADYLEGANLPTFRPTPALPDSCRSAWD